MIEVPLGTGAPAVFLIVAVMMEEPAPSAGIVSGSAVRVMEPTTGALTKSTVVLVVMVPSP